MAKALVFINTLVPRTIDFIKDLGRVEGVSEAHASLGLYDAIAMVQADSLNQIKDIVSKGIRGMDQVKSTLTLTLIEST